MPSPESGPGSSAGAPKAGAGAANGAANGAVNGTVDGAGGVTPPVAIAHEGEVCRLAGSIDFDNARAALEAVAPLVERGAASRIDLGGIVRSNSAGLALMIEWLAIARRAGHPLEFVAPPEGLRQLAAVCQVEGLILPSS